MKKHFLFFLALTNFTYGQKNNKKLKCKITNPYSYLLEDRKALSSISKNQNIQPQKIQEINRLIKNNKIVRTEMILAPLVTLLSAPKSINTLAKALDYCDALPNPNICSLTNITEGIFISSIIGLYFLTFFYKLYHYSKDRKNFL